MARKKPIITHTAGCFPLELNTHIFKDGTITHTVADGRLPPNERTEIKLTPAAFSRIVAGASAESLDNIALFLHVAVHGELPNMQGETVFEVKKKEELS
jgi:hypothetical protein